MGMKRDEIESMILASIPDATVDIKDLAGDDNHYAATVTSNKFKGICCIYFYDLCAALQVHKI